ncbi:MAG: DUF4981 domain-containing protein [Bacteroidales bacterium]|nr:DUF4981 domain-containing protein [Bacteroidales bacterium]
MKLITTLLCLASAVLPGKADVLPLHRDINALSVGVQDKRTEVVFFPDAESAMKKNIEQSPFYKCLNGEWDFLYFDSEKQVPADLSGVEWSKIKVPGNWEVQGWGLPIYVNIPYEFASVDPEPPTLPEDIPVGIYHRSFTVPSEWSGREVYLNVCGAKSGVYTFLNGKEIAYSEDSKDLARIDITPYLKEGENELLMKMTRWSTGSWLECQDFWRISGIERDVYLSSEKVKQDFDFEVVSTLFDGYVDGDFRLFANPGTSFKLLDNDGSVVAEGSVPFKGRIPAVRKWSAETPELYTLVLEKEGEYARFDVGFRRTEITKDAVLLFNGQPVKFKGVNLHEHNEFTGHYTSREYIRRSLLVMKSLNVNTIRTCHYPQPRAFYELCDSLGFYVYDETNIESHGMHYGEKSLAKHIEWLPKHKDRTLNMYMRTRNFPCVTLLSLGNEAGMGINFMTTYKMLKELEKGKMNRPVVYERTEGKEGTDVHCPMYPKMTNLYYERDDDPVHKPYIACEYSHAMGNSNGSFDLMWQLMYSHPRMQGGCIWDWVDQGLAVKDAKGRKYWTYGGDYGDIEKDPAAWFADRNFNCNGVVNPDLDVHPAGAEIKHWYQNVWVSEGEYAGQFKVLNRNYFRSLDKYGFAWTLYADGEKVSDGTLAFATAPQAEEAFEIELPSMAMDHTWYINFTVTNAGAQPALEDGCVLAANQVVLVRAEPPVAKHVAGKVASKVRGNGQIVLKAKRSKLVFDPVAGKVVSFKSRGKNLIDKKFGLKPNFWRAPIDNDWGNKYPVRGGEWKNDPAVNSVNVVDGENCSSVIVDYGLPSGCSAKVVYELSYAGDLRLTTDFVGSSEPAIEVPRIGFRTRMKASADKFRYFGRGPVENYVDRNTAAFLGLYEGSAEKELYPYVRPQETGHHTDCDWLEIGNALVLGVDEPFEFNALRASIEDLDPRNEDGSRIWGHVNDIPVRPFVELCIDGAMTGVGGYDSWGAKPEPSRTLFSNQNYHYEFVIGRK